MINLRPLTLLLAVALPVASAACRDKPRAGDPCAPADRGRTQCQGPSSALACQQGTWQVIQCSGPRGCSEERPPATCDESAAAAGEPCNQGARRPPGEDHACSVDGTTSLVCVDGRWETSMPCRGEKGCISDSGVHCDQTRAEVGDACNDTLSSFGACSTDGKAALRCDTSGAKPGARNPGRANGVFAIVRPCSPRTGCRVGHVGTLRDMPAVLCDPPDAHPGASCLAGTDDLTVCSEDHKHILRCDASRLVFSIAQTCLDNMSCQPVEPGSNALRCKP